MIKAKKSLGQNFLIDNNILNKIVNTTDISNKIASLEHTRWVIATTGSYDIFCLVALESSEELGNFIRLDIGSIEGIIRTETFVNLLVAKREYGA